MRAARQGAAGAATQAAAKRAMRGHPEGQALIQDLNFGFRLFGFAFRVLLLFSPFSVQGLGRFWILTVLSVVHVGSRA